MQGWERAATPYQSKDPSPTIPTKVKMDRWMDEAEAVSVYPRNNCLGN